MSGARATPRLVALGSCLLLAVAALAASEPLLLGRSFPIEVAVSMPAGLLHWLDSLAGLDGPGMTAGKTVPAHRQEYAARFGALDDESGRTLGRFADARRGLAARLPRERRYALSLAFLTAPDVESALGAVAKFATAEELDAVRAAAERFAPRYARIWNDGALPRRFLARVRGDERRDELAALLVRLARFYDVPASAPPHPRIVLVPVPPGSGTHAQAIERHLLIEIRGGEGLAEQVAPLVHENAHFLYYRVGRARLGALERAAAERGEPGREAWQLLHEALPTALGQGIAAQRFGRDLSTADPWYHRESVDAYAKRLFPLVRDVLETGGRFDEAFVRRAVALHAGSAAPATPRSP